MPRWILLKSAIKPSGGLPWEYQELKYIQSTGSQYIDTGVLPTINTVSQFKFMSIATTWATIFGYDNPDNNDYRLFNYGSSIYFDFGTDRIIWGTCAINNVYEWEMWNYYIKQVWATSNLVSGTTKTSFSASKNIRLNYGWSAYAQVRWYYVKIYENGVLLRDLIPCYRKADDETWMYDLVTNQFFAKIGNVQYTKGPEIRPDWPATVNYDFKTQDVLTYVNKQNSYTWYWRESWKWYYCHEQSASYYRTNVVYKLPSTDYTWTLKKIKLTVNPDNLYSGAWVTMSSSGGANPSWCGLGGWDTNAQNKMSRFWSYLTYNYNTGSQVLVIDLDNYEMYIEWDSNVVTLSATEVTNLQNSRSWGTLNLNIVANLPNWSWAKTYIEALEVFTY